MKAEVLLEHLRQALLREAQLRLELALLEAREEETPPEGGNISPSEEGGEEVKGGEAQ